jgi:hypothetical protein
MFAASNSIRCCVGSTYVYPKVINRYLTIAKSRCDIGLWFLVALILIAENISRRLTIKLCADGAAGD